MSAADHHKPLKKRSWPRKLLIGSLSLIGLICIAITTSLLWLNSSSGHRYLSGYISKTLNTADLNVNVGGLSGSIYSKLKVTDITVADSQGLWLTIPSLDLEWAPFDLVGRDLTITALNGEAIVFERLPEPPAASPSEDGGGIASFLERIDIGALDLSGTYAAIPFGLEADGLIVSANQFAGAVSLNSVPDSDTVTITFAKTSDDTYDLHSDILLTPGGLFSALTGLELKARSEANLSAIINTASDLSVTYQLSAPDVALEAASIRSVRLDGVLSAVDGGGYTSDFALAADAIAAEDTVLSPLKIAGLVSLDGDDWSVNLDQVAVSDYAIDRLSANGQSSQLKSAEAGLSLSADVLSGLSADQVTAGTVDVLLSLHHQGDQNFDFDLGISGRGIGYADDALKALLGDTPVVEASGTVSTSGDILLNDSTITMKQISADLSGAFVGESQELDLKLAALVDQAALQAIEAIEISSPLALDVSVSGPVTAPIISISTKRMDIVGYSVALSDAAAEVTLVPGDTADWTGEFAITATSPSGPVALTSAYTFDQGSLDIPSIALDTAFASGAGSATWNQEDGPSGAFDIALNPIETDAITVTGSAEAKLTLSSQTGVLSGEMTINGSQINVARSGDFPIFADTLLGSARLSLGEGAPQVSANITIKDIGYGAKTISSVSIIGDTSTSEPIKVLANGNWGQAFDLDLGWQSDGDTAAVTGRLNLGTISINTGSPIVLSFKDGLDIAVENLDINGGEINGKIAWKDGALASMALGLNGLSHDLLDPIAPGLLNGGSLSGSIQLTEADNQLTGTAELGLTALSFPSTGRFVQGALYASNLNLILDKDTAKLSGNVLMDGQEVGTMTGALPMQIAADLSSLALDMDTVFAAELDWSGDVTPLWSVVKRPGHQLSGNFAGNLKAGGTFNDPNFEGTLALTDGRYEYAPLAFTASIDTLLVRGSQDFISLESLAASDGEGGTLTGSGRFDLQQGTLLPGEMTLNIQNFRMARRDDLNSIASANLNYLRSAEGNSLTGSIETGPTTFQIPKELPVSIIDLDVTEINKPNTIAAEPMDRFGGTSERFAPTNLDIQLTVPRRFVLSGRGLYSEWAGQIQLTGNTDDPRLLGQLQLGQGYFDFGSKRFTFTEGALNFGGLRGFDPILALKAEYESPTIKAMMSIGGRATALSFSLSSEPSLPEDEILSRVLIGKSVTDLDVLQLAELAAAAQSLRGSNFDAIGSVRKSLGLDTLSVSNSAAEDGGTLITGGKYLLNNVYLEVETSPSSSETATRLRIDLTKRFLVETEVGPRQGNSLYLKWFWDY